MERRLLKKIDEYGLKFKEDLCNCILDKNYSEPDKIRILKFIYDYPKIQLNNSDFQKRKRVKNVVPFYDRCCAKRANGDQCTRRRKEESTFCGTHIKGTPHGTFTQEKTNVSTMQKVEVWAEDIKGIIHYIDAFNNVYKQEDVIANKKNPKIIAKYELSADNLYSIPDIHT